MASICIEANALHHLTAIWPAGPQIEAVRRVEAFFGTPLVACESSHYNSPIYRWMEMWVAPRWAFWRRWRVAPVAGLRKIEIYDNVEPDDGEPWHAGFPADAWVVSVSLNDDHPPEAVRDFLAAHGTLLP